MSAQHYDEISQSEMMETLMEPTSTTLSERDLHKAILEKLSKSTDLDEYNRLHKLLIEMKMDNLTLFEEYQSRLIKVKKKKFDLGHYMAAKVLGTILGVVMVTYGLIMFTREDKYYYIGLISGGLAAIGIASSSLIAQILYRFTNEKNR